jgi:hypothetical protein
MADVGQGDGSSAAVISELDINIGEKTYRLSFSRVLSFDERRRVSGMSLSGYASTPV